MEEQKIYEFKVDEKFTLDSGEELVCIINENEDVCEDCFFNNIDVSSEINFIYKCSNLECSKNRRKDKQDVVFFNFN